MQTYGRGQGGPIPLRFPLPRERPAAVSVQQVFIVMGAPQIGVLFSPSAHRIRTL